VRPITNEGTRFEIRSINQLSYLAFLISFGGLLGNSFVYGLGPFQWLLLAYSIIFLMSPLLNAIGHHFWAKLLVFYNFQVYHLLLGLLFGLSSQAHIIYIVAIVFVFLFFSEEQRWKQVLLMLSVLAFPILLFVHSNGILNIEIGITATKPQGLGTTVYFTSMVVSMVIMYMTFGNLRQLVQKYTRNNIDLLNANAAMKAKTQERTDLFAQVVHDLKSPLHSLMGLTKLLDDEKDPVVRQHIMDTWQPLV
jgi:signal transduction histidine kinase